MTQTVDRTAQKTVEPVTETAAPGVRRTVGPAIDTATKTATPVANTLTNTAAPVLDAAGKTTAPVAHTLVKTAAPVLHAVANTAAPIANTTEPATHTIAKAVVAPAIDDIDKGTPPLVAATGSIVRAGSSHSPLTGAASRTTSRRASAIVRAPAAGGLALASPAGEMSSAPGPSSGVALGSANSAHAGSLKEELVEGGVLGFEQTRHSYEQTRHDLSFQAAEMWSLASGSSALLPALLGGERSHEMRAPAGSFSLVPVPSPSPIPAGGFSGAMASSASVTISIFLTLAGLLILVGSQAMRRLRLASEPWRVAPFVLIPERPG